MRSPDPKREVAAIVGRLLLHYFVPGEISDGARKAMAEDWVEDLAEFPPQIVADACRTWRRKPNGRRPLPGDIRALCIAEQREQQERRAIAGPSDMDEYARSVGWANNAERMEAIRRDEAKRNDPAAWERLRRIEDEIKLGRSGSLRQAAGPAWAAAAGAGVKAREVTPEEMRRSQIELGIKPPESDPADAQDEQARRDSIAQAREYPWDEGIAPGLDQAVEAAE